MIKNYSSPSTSPRQFRPVPRSPPAAPRRQPSAPRKLVKYNKTVQEIVESNKLLEEKIELIGKIKDIPMDAKREIIQYLKEKQNKLPKLALFFKGGKKVNKKLTLKKKRTKKRTKKFNKKV